VCWFTLFIGYGCVCRGQSASGSFFKEVKVNFYALLPDLGKKHALWKFHNLCTCVPLVKLMAEDECGAFMK
jgi:hypothetical protein